MQQITLNIRYDSAPDEYIAVDKVSKTMPGWIGDNEHIYKWFGQENQSRYILGSVEPGGFLIVGEIDDVEWSMWIAELQNRLTVALGRTIHDAEI